jgi:two-component system response regulator YesN
LGLIDYDKAVENENIYYKDCNGDKMVIYTISSDYSDWEFVSVIPKKIYWRSSDIIRNWMIGGAVFCIVLGIIFAYFYSRANYTPVERLLSFFEKSQPARNIKENEYMILQESIKQTFREREIMQSRIEKQNKIVRSNILIWLLQGRIKEEFINYSVMESYGIFFKEEKFFVMFISVDDYSKFTDGHSDKATQEEDKALVNLVVNNAYEELINQRFRGYTVELDGNIVCIVNINDEQVNEIEDEVRRIVAISDDILLDKCGILLTMAVSEVQNGLKGISAAYGQALEALEYRRILEGMKVIYYREIERLSASDFIFTKEMEQKLVNCFVKFRSFSSIDKS